MDNIKLKKESLDNENMVELKVWYRQDGSHSYNHEYMVRNWLLDQQWNFDGVIYTGDIKEIAKKRFEQEVERNNIIINRVKNYLNA